MADRYPADRAVSDLLGFALVFGLVISTVGVTYATGFTGLEDARDVERVNNAERAFDVFATNVEDVTRRGAPGRATEMKLADATVRPGDPVRFNLTLDGSSYAAEFRPIVYDAGTGSRIVYSGGAVIREQRRGSVLVREPPTTIGDRTVVPFVVTRPEDTGIGGTRTVLLRTVAADRTLLVEKTRGPYDVTLNVTSPRSAVWEEYVESEHDATCTTDGNTTSCSFEAERVSVPVWKVDVAFD